MKKTSMSKTITQKIFKSAVVERLRNNLYSGISLASYFEEDFSVDESQVLSSTITLEGRKPELKVPEKDPVSADLQNAIALHRYYKDIDETQASDPRLWMYLSHVEFRKYTIARWGLDGAYADIEQDDEKKAKAIRYLFEHWFAVGDSDRDLRRHALARLWWAAHLTYAPWEVDPEFFGDLKNEDPYFYTSVLLSTQDIYQQVLERSMGRSNRILISVLDFLSSNAEFAKSRSKVRGLMKELNLVYGTKKIIALDRTSLKLLIKRISDEIADVAEEDSE
ncbi:hypothetical protein HGA34_05805 [Candidatus Falkowbacteria bacterium]|nr:hypothetical protein [Candidatus Falkowbacteria bacterium]